MLEKKLKNLIKEKLKDNYMVYYTENSNAMIVPGWPDICIINRFTNEMMFIETKVNGNTQRMNQVWIEDVMKVNNMTYILMTEENYEDLCRLLNEE